MVSGRGQVVLTIVLINLRIWFNGIARSLGSRRAAWMVTLGVGVLVATWTVVSTDALSRQLRLNAAAAAELSGPVTGIAFTLPAIATLLMMVYSPHRSLLNNVLAVLPVRHTERVTATRWLNAGLGMVLGGVWAAPLALQFALVSPFPTAAMAMFVCSLLGCAGALSAQALFSIGEAAWTWILGSRGIVTTAAAGAGAALLLAWMFIESLPVQGQSASRGPLGLVARPLTAVVSGLADAAPLVVLLVLGTATAGIAARAADRLPRRTQRQHLSLGLSWPSGRTLLGLEVRQWLRFPINATSLVFTGLVLAVSAVVWSSRPADAQVDEVAYLFFALVSTVGIGSFGPTRPAHWIYGVSGRPNAWILPKFASVLVVWATLVAGVAVVFEVTTSWSVQDGLTLLPTLLLELVTGCVVGLVLPVSREQSLGSAMSEGLGIVVVLSVTLGLQSLPWTTSETGYVLTHLGVGMALILGYVAIARSSGRNLLAVSA